MSIGRTNISCNLDCSQICKTFSRIVTLLDLTGTHFLKFLQEHGKRLAPTPLSWQTRNQYATITSCPKCSCGCKQRILTSCLRFLSSSPSSDDPSSVPEDAAIGCTDHMCPVLVHWHVKNNYEHHWRLKLTVSSFFCKKNYSDWNILTLHPGFRQSAKVYSFNSTILPSVEPGDEAALFWGKEYCNTILLHSDKDKLGSVSTEILLKKDLEDFTLSNGWAFPQRIYFDGENCEMPLPDTFPMLPNGATNLRPTLCRLLLIILTYLTFRELL